MVKKIVLFLIVLPWLLWAFAPKKELYYWVEKQMAAQGIVLANERIGTTPIGLSIDHADLYAKGVKVATIDHASLWSLLLYTRGGAQRITLDPTLAKMLPGGVKSITATHSIARPTVIALSIDDPRLSAVGSIDLRTRTLTLTFAKAPAEGLKRYIHKTKGGWVYEQRF
jgi:hypothetical protein